MRRRLALAVTSAALALCAAAPAAAAAPPAQGCWGVVTQQRATTEGGIGEHSSSQDTPRLGLGNVARIFLGEDGKVSELGSLLASLDGIAETHCP